jgi:hypothetical protein
MEEMMAGIESNRIQPVLDEKVFALEELREALEHLVGPFCSPGFGLLDFQGFNTLIHFTGSSEARWQSHG